MKKKKEPISEKRLMIETGEEIVSDFIRDSLHGLAENVIDAAEKNLELFESGERSVERFEHDRLRCDLMIDTLGSHLQQLDNKENIASRINECLNS